MRGGESIGWALAFEFAPAAIFGSATAFSAAIFLGLPQFGMAPVAAGAAAFGGIWLALSKFGSHGRALPLAEFEQSPLELSPVSELLEQADVVALVERLGAAPAAKREIEEELVLEDVLEAIETDSRVVRLFEPSDTAGEMQARIDRHLHSTRRQAQADAAQELHEALAALRRSLR
jgi:hypothetical protein